MPPRRKTKNMFPDSCKNVVKSPEDLEKTPQPLRKEGEELNERGSRLRQRQVRSNTRKLVDAECFNSAPNTESGKGRPRKKIAAKSKLKSHSANPKSCYESNANFLVDSCNEGIKYSQKERKVQKSMSTLKDRVILKDKKSACSDPSAEKSENSKKLYLDCIDSTPNEIYRKREESVSKVTSKNKSLSSSLDLKEMYFMPGTRNMKTAYPKTKYSRALKRSCSSSSKDNKVLKHEKRISVEPLLSKPAHGKNKETVCFYSTPAESHQRRGRSLTKTINKKKFLFHSVDNKIISPGKSISDNIANDRVKKEGNCTNDKNLTDFKSSNSDDENSLILESSNNCLNISSKSMYLPNKKANHKKSQNFIKNIAGIESTRMKTRSSTKSLNSDVEVNKISHNSAIDVSSEVPRGFSGTVSETMSNKFNLGHHPVLNERYSAFDFPVMPQSKTTKVPLHPGHRSELTSVETTHVSTKQKEEHPDKLQISEFVRDYAFSRNQTGIAKPKLKIHSDENPPSLKYHSNTEATLYSKNTKLFSAKPKLSTQRCVSPLTIDDTEVSGDDNMEYSSDSDSSNISKRPDKEVQDTMNRKSSKFDSTGKKLHFEAVKRPTSVESKSYLTRWARDKEDIPYKGKEGYSKKMKRPQPVSDYLCTNSRNKLDEGICYGADEDGFNGDYPVKVYKIKKFRVSPDHRFHSQNSATEMSKEVKSELSSSISVQSDDDIFISETNPLEDEVPSSELSSPNENNQYLYQPLTEQSYSTTSFTPFPSYLVRSSKFENNFINLPQHVNWVIVPSLSQFACQSQGASQTQNIYGNIPMSNNYSVPHSSNTIPIYPIGSMLQSYNPSVNRDLSFVSGGRGSNVAQFISKDNLNNRVSKFKSELNFQNPNLIAHTFQNTTNTIIRNSSKIQNFSELIKNIELRMRKKCFDDMCNFNCRYFSERPSSLQLTVNQFFSNPLVLNTFFENIPKSDSHFDDPSKLEYVFKDNFLKSSIRDVIKEYVDFYVRALYKAPASKKHFVKLAMKKLPLRDCAYLCEVFPEDDETFNLKDLTCYLCSAALLAIFDEFCKKQF